MKKLRKIPATLFLAGTLIMASSCVDSSSESPDSGSSENELKNLITKASVEKIYFAPGWTEDSSASATGSLSEGFTYLLPAATGAQWQAQIFINTDADISSGKSYNLTANVKSTINMSDVTVKWAATTDQDSEYWFETKINLTANKTYAFSYTKASSIDDEDGFVIFDFGNNGAGKVTITDLVLKENKETSRKGNTITVGSTTYSLVWSDEFTSCDSDNTPLSSNWGYDVGRGQSTNTDGTNPNNWAWGNNEDQWYSNNDPDNTYVSDGTLKIKAIKESAGSGATWTSGRIVTRGIRAWKYGYFEMKAKLPNDAGVWPAFWMLNKNIYNGSPWPDSGEIDIMETSESVWDVPKGLASDTSYVCGTLHCKAGSGGSPIISQGTNLKNIDSQYHTYAVEWTEKQIKWYFDGVNYITYTPENYENDPWPFDQEFYIIVNLAVGGNLGGNIDSSLTESTMEIDYVRVYQ